MECSWAGLLAKVEKAEDLDQVIQAHDHFLDHVTRQCLLDDTSQTLLTQLRAIYDLIIQFQHTQATMLGACVQELGRREALDASRDKLAAQVRGGKERGIGMGSGNALVIERGRGSPQGSHSL